MQRSLSLLLVCSLTPSVTHGLDPLDEPQPIPPGTALSWSSSRPDGHAPIGVMGEHRHRAGEWMVSYRAMTMHMDGSRDGTNRIADTDVTDPGGYGFMITPTEMDMTMHMLGLMYAPSDDVTLMAMIPFLDNSMDHRTGMGGEFSTESSGLGDVRLGGLIGISEGEHKSVHLNATLSIPTGSIDETDLTPMGVARLPYPMQLGSGTYDLVPGITFLGQSDEWSWGAQATATVRLGTNGESYRLGNRADATGWVARKFSERTSASLRLIGSHWADIHGADATFTNPMMVPTARPDLRAGNRIDVGLGCNVLTKGGHRFALELAAPVYQDLDGPQLETDWTLTFGWQLAWGGDGHRH